VGENGTHPMRYIKHVQILLDCALRATQPALFLPRKAEFSINFGKLIVSPRYHPCKVKSMLIQ